MAKVELSHLDLRDERWVALTISQPYSSIFHHPAWVNMLKSCYGYQPTLLAILNKVGQPASALILMQTDSLLTGQRIVSLPFSDFCPPLTVDNISLSDLVEGLLLWRRHNKAPEIRIHWPLPEMDGVYPGECFARHITHLDPESQRVFRSFAKTRVQQPIRNAERDGVIIKMSDKWEDLRLFYGLHLETRRRLGSPIQPLRFFQLLWSLLISRGFGFVILAYKDAQPLAGAVFLHWNRTLTYKYSASDPAYWKLRPNNLVLWHAIRWGCENGYEVFDWGRTDLANGGLREFKQGWGSEEQILNYSVLADHPPKPSMNGKAYHLLTTLIQKSPTWVCRAMGELFYQHFGG